MARFVALLAAVGTLGIAPCWAQVQTVRAEAIEVHRFLQHTGAFSAPLTESSELWNIIIGTEDEERAERPSSSTFVRVQVSGAPGSYDRKNSVTLSVTAKGRRVHTELLRKELGVFGKKGKQYVGFWLPNTGCEELDLVAWASSRTAAVKTKVPFACGE